MSDGEYADKDYIIDDAYDCDSKQLKRYQEFLDDEVEEDENEEDSDDGVPLVDKIKSMKPRVVNIVAIVDFGVQFDLYKVAREIRNAEYNPRRFGACVLRLEKPKATALVFKDKMNIVGCRAEEDAELAARKFGRMMKLIGYKLNKWKSFEIKNLVATISCNFPLNLEAIATDPGHRHFAKYNPEVFAGCVYRIPHPRVTLLIFASGKIIMTAARNRQMLDDASEWVYPILRMFEKPNPVDMEASFVEEPEKEQVKEEAPAPEVKPEPVKKKRDPFARKPRS